MSALGYDHAPATRTASVRELGRMLPETGRLIQQLATDSRVPAQSKVVAASALALVGLSFANLRGSLARRQRWSPARGVGAGVAVVLALRYLVRAAGYDLVRESWTGTDQGFATVVIVAGVYQ